MCLETGEVFKSGREAAKKLNLQRSKISNVCKGKRKSTGGYTFCFID
jgi:plasmid maintenance system antidote protein VapI